MPSHLLATKLHRPSPPPKRVPRLHLVERLNEGLESGRAVTLVSAPAGFGKTTCAGEWAASLGLPVAWLSLDPTDDEPARFLTYLLAALQEVDQGLGRELESALHSGQLPSAEAISTTLGNDILALPGRFLLILDDFQVIQDRLILQVFEQLLASPPPPLHLVLLTREDPSLPLARLRANDRMTEIRSGDLRFDGSEAGRFLNEVLGLGLSEADIAVLVDHTEGWVVGLQLAGLSVRGRADPSAFIAGLSGSHRFILSYLAEQVLDRQPEDIRRFLLQTSVLDRLCGDLCDAVTGRGDGHLLLERLFNANLFLVPLDDEQRWYRYHHLFADLLRSLSTRRHDDTAELHRRAARWYALAGLPDEAIRHALAAADYALAVQVIESHAMDMVMQWHVKTVDGWMRALPPEWAAQSPRANLAFACKHVFSGDYAQASPYLERLQARFSGPQADEADPSLKAGWLALQALLLGGQGAPAQSLDLANRALAIASQDDSDVQSLIYLALAGAYQELDDDARAVEALQTLIRHGRAAGNIAAEMLGVSDLALIAIERGRLHLAFEVASEGIERAQASGSPPPITTAIYAELGVAHYQWHQLEEARRCFVRAIEVSARSSFSDAAIYYRVVLSRLSQMEGDLEAAAREVQEAANLMRLDAPGAVGDQVVAQQVRIYLARGESAAAEAALEGQGFFPWGRFTLPVLAPDAKITPATALLYNCALRIALHRAQTRQEEAGLEPALELADRLIAGALRRHYVPTALETLLLRAQVHAALGDQERALADYAHALQLGEPEGYISIFIEEGAPVGEGLAALLEHNRLQGAQVEYARSILAALAGGDKPAAAPVAAAPPVGHGLIEPLSPRELEVLCLIAEGCSNKEIAERLVITVSAVKKHTANIYGKLSVSSRTQALARARQLGLLSA